MIVTLASRVTGGFPAVTTGPTTEVVTTGGRLRANTVTASGTETLDRPSTSVTTNDTVRAPTNTPAVVANVIDLRASWYWATVPVPVNVKTPVAALYDPVIGLFCGAV